MILVYKIIFYPYTKKKNTGFKLIYKLLLSYIYMSYLYRTGTGRNNIGYTTTVNSSTKYLRRTSTGRNNIAWSTIPAGSTYNILNRTGTSRNNIAWGNLNIPVPKGSQTFTAYGTFTVPSGVTSIQVFCVGGGAGGESNGEGGAGAGYTTNKTVSVTPGQSISVVIGAGGTGWIVGHVSSTRQTAGGSTSFGSLVTAAGGKITTVHQKGADGGSGGGAGGVDPGRGGTNGSNGIGSTSFPNGGGRGQGTTTRAFGESNGTLYSTGGDGSDSRGGAGYNKSANTGNGGDAGGSGKNGGNGGSGILLVRWGY